MHSMCTDRFISYGKISKIDVYTHLVYCVSSMLQLYYINHVVVADKASSYRGFHIKVLHLKRTI